MKKNILLVAIILVVAVQSVFGALDFTLSDYNVDVPIGGTVTVDMTASNNGEPISVPVEVQLVCRETTAPEFICNEGDIYNPSEVIVSVTSPTDVAGVSTVTIAHDGSDVAGIYHYTICHTNGVDCFEDSARVTGDFGVIPEFTTIGAAVALIGAGIFAAKKKRKE
ncbi:MAG: LPXTG cell wall anchor domain-containing protein [archaeon]